jgi:plastocyanin
MRSSRLVRGLVALTMLTSFVAACGDDDDDEGTSSGETTTTEAAVEAQTIDVTAIDYAFQDAPAELEAGVVTVNFKNEGKVEHEFALIESGDAEQADFLARFAPALSEGGPFPDEAQNVAAPVEIGPGDTASVTFTVNEGKYTLLCTLDGDAEKAEETGQSDEEDGEEEAVDPAKIHFNRGMAQPLTVTAGEDDAALPDADGSITAHDYTFDVDVTPDDDTVNFTNTGDEDQVHFASILEFPEGTTEQQALDAFNAFTSAEEGQAPPEGTVEPSDDEFGFSGVFSKGLGSHLTPTKKFKSGHTYVFACFIQDRTGGPPHALPVEAGGHGMVKAVTVQ